MTLTICEGDPIQSQLMGHLQHWQTLLQYVYWDNGFNQKEQIFDFSYAHTFSYVLAVEKDTFIIAIIPLFPLFNPPSIFAGTASGKLPVA